MVEKRRDHDGREELSKLKHNIVEESSGVVEEQFVRIDCVNTPLRGQSFGMSRLRV